MIPRPPAVALFLALAVLSGAWSVPLQDGVHQVRPAPGSKDDMVFRPGPIRFIAGKDVGNPTVPGYWYMTYTVINNTREEQVWAPRMELFNDKGDILRSGRNVPRFVTSAILKKVGDPLLMDQFQILGSILPGEAQARSGLVIWVAQPMDASKLTLFVRGLSKVVEKVQNPVTGSSVPLYRTLRRDYVVPGEPDLRGAEPIHFVAEEWIMR